MKPGSRLRRFGMRPLDPVRSIKLKIGTVVLGSCGSGLAIFWLGVGSLPVKVVLVAVTVSLATSQVLAHGMTSPLREMTAVARAMAVGDYTGRRVRATSRDEVGQLASAFNRMADELAAADHQRRELIANVSHELRTPISAVQAVLENIVDGVAAPDPATLRTALALTERLGHLVTELLDLSCPRGDIHGIYRSSWGCPRGDIYGIHRSARRR
jgi:signal transduction histidine kinase